MSKQKIYACIDFKSFYASVECIERGLDPLDTNLVVADNSRTEKTICLAVSPSLKSFGIPARPRLFEVIQKVKIENIKRGIINNFSKESFSKKELSLNPNFKISYIVATPRMSLYMKYSSEAFKIYLRYFSPDDIFSYSIDEVFIDITDYLTLNKKTPRQLVQEILATLKKETGIVATAGIGTNLFLAKVALDIMAKHAKIDETGSQIAELDIIKYRKELWNHRPITDFWRIGRGYAKRLAQVNIFTMGDIARCSLGKVYERYNEDLLYEIFGINAELLIDHSWGIEPCTIKDIKNFKPKINSLSSGQVLHEPYEFNKVQLIVKEMIEQLALDLVEKRFATSQLVLTVLYDVENLKVLKEFEGPIGIDYYGRKVPVHAHGTINIGFFTSSSRILKEKILELLNKIVNKKLLVRKIYIACNTIDEKFKDIYRPQYKQLSLFETENEKNVDEFEINKEKEALNAIIKIKKKFGKNSILKVSDLSDGATTKDRNLQIGGHKS